jgi:hypothetical protein
VRLCPWPEIGIATPTTDQDWRAVRAGKVARRSGVCLPSTVLAWLASLIGHIVAPTVRDFWILSRDSAINVSTLTKKASSFIYSTGSSLVNRIPAQNQARKPSDLQTSQ